MCHQLRSGSGWREVNRSAISFPRKWNNIFSDTDFTPHAPQWLKAPDTRADTRQAGCMAKTDKRRSTKSTKSTSKSTLSKQIELAIRAADDKKADALIVLDLRKTAGFTDYFVICSGSNPRQVRAIADAVTEALAAAGARPTQVEGYDRSEWILLDYFDFVVHIFAPETRAFYGLERLWGNAEHVDTDAILTSAHH